MSPDKLFGLIALLCLLLWMLPRVVPLSAPVQRVMIRAAYVMLGGGILLALLLAAQSFLA